MGLLTSLDALSIGPTDLEARREFAFILKQSKCCSAKFHMGTIYGAANLSCSYWFDSAFSYPWAATMA